MESVAEFMSMGGYGGYVWPAFGIVLFVMALLWVASMRGWRNSEKILATLRNSRREREDVAE